MARPLVVITDFIQPPLGHEERILGDLADITALDAFSEEALAGRIEEADAIMMYHFLSIGEQTIRRLKKCRLIVRCGVGYDNVDRAAARARGIDVANVPDYGTEEVADSAIAMLLTMMRGVSYMNTRLQNRQGPWIYQQVRPLHRLRGLRLGIIGLGRIGMATALRAKALGLEVLFYDPSAVDGLDKALGVVRCESLEEMLPRVQAISLHCPRTAETQALINARTIALLPRGAFVVNTARGGCVDSGAVLAAIESEHLRGAALDVLEVEPPPDDDPLIAAWRQPGTLAHDRVIINPHAAFYSEEGLDDMRIKGSTNIRRVLNGQPPRNVVN
ncbi:MAG: C-terminal binding protein [Planctomycetota bacterium]|nr:MAG: C-terminal binding protein [Planctomycetota bacterium]